MKVHRHHSDINYIVACVAPVTLPVNRPRRPYPGDRSWERTSGPGRLTQAPRNRCSQSEQGLECCLQTVNGQFPISTGSLGARCPGLETSIVSGDQTPGIDKVIDKDPGSVSE